MASLATVIPTERVNTLCNHRAERSRYTFAEAYYSKGFAFDLDADESASLPLPCLETGTSVGDIPGRSK